MLKRLFFILATIYFIGKATNVIDTFFVGEETAIECTGECENGQEEVKGNNYFDKHFSNFEMVFHKSSIPALIQIAYYFKSKLIASIHSNQFSPPPELV
ncbi:hypothetical protein [Telluribacter sp. SYSU D00476]|uniref:hypothetical protein n=1 Tax=Telluribacter sp. SYSU D00476 TaxID=2811430 RepID=UPI001FF4EAB2|nr:hypothetical protein [Telluribacter sp. SYSU D00476]